MLPEFVAAVATATEAEVLAVVLTALDTPVHIGQQPVELRRLRGCLQGEVAQVAQIERSVPVAGNGQQFWIKRGEISLPIDAQDRKGAVQFVLGHALIPLDQADHLLKLPQNNGVAVLFAESPERPQKVAVFALHGHPLHGGAGVNPLLFLHVEPNILDAVVAEKAVHPLRLFHGVFREHGNAMERHVISVQGLNSTHGHRMGAASMTEATVGVVNLLRTVHADAHHNPIAPEAVTPCVVDQCGIGLHMLAEIQIQGTVLHQTAVEELCGCVVPAGRERQRFPRMPDQGEFRPGVGAFEDALDQ